MPVRVLEVAFVVAFSAFTALLIAVAGMMNTSIPEEQIALQELRAKQLLLALDTLPATQDGVPPETSVLDLLRMYYITQRQEYLDYAKNDIYYYARGMLPDSAWLIETQDSQLKISSPLYSRARICGSATVPLLATTNITAVVCTL